MKKTDYILVGLIVTGVMGLAFMVAIQWDDIVWTATMRSKYELKDSDGMTIPYILLRKTESYYEKIYYLTNVVDVPFTIRDIDGASSVTKPAGIVFPKDVVELVFHDIAGNIDTDILTLTVQGGREFPWSLIDVAVTTLCIGGLFVLLKRREH